MAQVHLLIVEDSQLVTQALRVLFEEHGYHVSVADTVSAAVDCAAGAAGDHQAHRANGHTRALSGTAAPVDVMLLDLTLPDGDGLSVLAKLRDMERTPHFTIALTGHDDDSIQDRCLAAGCRTVLLKPVPTRELLAAVQACAVDLR